MDDYTKLLSVLSKQSKKNFKRKQRKSERLQARFQILACIIAALGVISTIILSLIK